MTFSFFSFSFLFPSFFSIYFSFFLSFFQYVLSVLFQTFLALLFYSLLLIRTYLSGFLTAPAFYRNTQHWRVRNERKSPDVAWEKEWKFTAFDKDALLNLHFHGQSFPTNHLLALQLFYYQHNYNRYTHNYCVHEIHVVKITAKISQETIVRSWLVRGLKTLLLA